MVSSAWRAGIPFEETISRIEGFLREKGIKLFATIDHSGEAERAGLKMPADEAAALRQCEGGNSGDACRAIGGHRFAVEGAGGRRRMAACGFRITRRNTSSSGTDFRWNLRVILPECVQLSSTWRGRNARNSASCAHVSTLSAVTRIRRMQSSQLLDRSHLPAATNRAML